jgi:hypothetical protein
MSDRERKQPVGDTGRHEPHYIDAGQRRADRVGGIGPKHRPFATASAIA